MALTATGFDGTVTESQMALMAPNFGPPVVEGKDDYKVTIVSSGADRTVAVAAGAADACFVRVVNSAPINKQSAVVASGTRWDTIVLRRNWSTNAVSVEVVQGTSAATIAAGVNDNPGVTHDQLLALVQITAGNTIPTSVVDLRRHGPGGTHASNILAAGTNPPLGTELVISGTRYRRTLDSGGNAQWSLADAPTVAAITRASGWNAPAAGIAAWTAYRDQSGRVFLNGSAVWGGGAQSIASTQLDAKLVTGVPLLTAFRPAARESGLVMVTATQFPWRVTVRPDGHICFAPASGSATLADTSELSLSGFSYQAV